MDSFQTLGAEMAMGIFMFVQIQIAWNLCNFRIKLSVGMIVKDYYRNSLR